MKTLFRTAAFALAVFCCPVLSAAAMTTEDFLALPIAKMRNTAEEAYQLLVIISNEVVKQPESAEANWIFAAMHYFVGDYYETNRETKKALYTLTRDYARIAVRLDPKSPDAHYWLAIGYAKWSEANGILESLFFADDILNELTAVLELQPSFFYGVAWAIRAKVYNFAPGWPLSIGNKEQSYKDILSAYQYGQNFRFIYQLNAEILLNDGRYAEAKTVISNGLSLPYDENFPREEERIISELKKDLAIAQSRTGVP